MFKNSRTRKGFTLIETLTSVAVVGVLAAVTIPTVTRQLAAGDPSRISQDLEGLRKGIELYTANNRPYYPGDVDDLVNQPGNLDLDLTGAFSGTRVASWKGPYLERTIADVNVGSGEAFLSGFSTAISQDFKQCAAAEGATPCGSGTDYIGVEVTGISADQFLLVNSIIDGAAESAVSTTAHTKGKFRYNTGSTTAYFLSFGYVDK